MVSETNKATAGPIYEVVWPLGKMAAARPTLNPPVSDLSGKTVCELWDKLFKGDEMFLLIREKLRERYPGIKFIDYTVFGNTHGPKEAEVVVALPDLLRKHGCDVVISGVGA